ncbi:MAG: 5-formyltetrahydrofolate cyclo-ligase [Pseudomonadales bacterium]|nr:5-formyltetrahydrofolate cyclo-ligase [Halioglobus sp.]MCP5128241.1 5-formyltetrahydrofolate cyclo-ligase [Pseudomonadales bacterium]
MPDRPPSKAHLRKELRQRRRDLGTRAQHDAAEAAARHITRLPHWSTARCIALYLANDGEVGTAPLGDLCRTAGKQLFLPVIDHRNMLTFAEWREADTLVPNRYGIPEPPQNSPRRAPGELDIIVMPLVGWDRLGGRLGMGGGFYDRALAAGGGALLVGLAHTIQEVPQVPREDWDVPLDVVVTEAFVHHCRER